MSSLDLELGDEEAADLITAKEEGTTRRRRQRRSSTAKEAPKRSDKKERAPGPDDTSIKGRIVAVFDRIVEQLRSRGDDELADAIDEDKGPMAQGLVSATRPFPPLRIFLVILLEVVEPFLAFGRVGRILMRRYMERRARLMEEAQRQSAYKMPPAPQDYVEGTAVTV